MSEDYTAKDIRILRDTEVVERFTWAKAGALAEQYKRPVAWIERGLAACEAAGIDHGYFIRRYLDGDKSVPMHEGADEAFRQSVRTTFMEGRKGK